MKRVWVALCFCLPFWMAATPAKAELTDIAGSYARSEIESLWQKGYVTGYQDGTFRPGGSMTRAEFAAILARSMELSPDEASAALFTDVPPWARPYVGALVSEKITYGISSTRFGPDQPLTREEMAVFFARAIDLESLAQSLDLVPPFADQLAIHSWASPAIAFLQSIQFIKGSGNYYYPLEKADRQAIARLTYEYAFRFASYIPNIMSVTVKTEAPDATDVKILDPENVQVTFSNGNIEKYLMEEIINGDYYYSIVTRSFQSPGYDGKLWTALDSISKQQMAQIALGSFHLTYSPYQVSVNDDLFISRLISGLDTFYSTPANQSVKLFDGIVNTALSNTIVTKKS